MKYIVVPPTKYDHPFLKIDELNNNKTVSEERKGSCFSAQKFDVTGSKCPENIEAGNPGNKPTTTTANNSHFKQK